MLENPPPIARTDLPGVVVIKIRLAELRQLFNAMDPAPFRERDLDPQAEDFIIGWAREASRGSHFALHVDLDRESGPVDETAMLREAISEFFSRRAVVTRQHLHQLLRTGRISLVIGLAFLMTAVGAGRVIAAGMHGQSAADLIQAGLAICGWVAMWRPLEIFLYDWWPIYAEAHLYDRLAAMSVKIEYGRAAESGAWQHDWPTRPPGGGRTNSDCFSPDTPDLQGR